LAARKPCHRLLVRLARDGNDGQRLHDRRRDISRPANRGERDEARAVGEIRLHHAPSFDRQARLAHPAGSGEGQHPPAATPDSVRDPPQVVVTTNGPVRRPWQPALTSGMRHRPQWRKARRQSADEDLKQVLGAIEVLQPVLSEIPERNVRRQLVRDELAGRA
jgi:hypothetical protein